MLEQEIASIMRFTIDKAGSPSPYYWEVPQDFLVPAVYFPPPEITSSGDTFLTYALDYTMFVKFFHKDTPSAQAIAFATLAAFQQNRNLVPLIDKTGVFTEKGIRLKDPALRKVETGSFQLELSWVSRRPYNQEKVQKMMVYHLGLYTKSAYAAAVKQTEKEEHKL